MTRRKIPFTKRQRRTIFWSAFGPLLIVACFVDLTTTGQNLPEWVRGSICLLSLFAGVGFSLWYIEQINKIERRLVAEGKI